MLFRSAVEVKAGRKAEIRFTIGENVEDSLISNREIEVKLDNAHFDYKGLVDEYMGTLVAADKLTFVKTALDSTLTAVPTSFTADDYKYLAAGLPSDWLAGELISDKADWSVGATNNATTLEFDVESDGKAIGLYILLKLRVLIVS